MPKATKTAKRRPAKRRVRERKATTLRGLLPVPREVAEIVARETSRLPMTKEARQRLENHLTLEYHFGGETVLYRYSMKGVEVFAVGLDEIREYEACHPPDEHSGIIMGFPDYWHSV